MSVLSAISRFAADYSAARSRYQTERLIRSLPREIQKDIGWPYVDDKRKTSRVSFGAWAGER
ncbi:hypothetical protein [Pseudaminobacter sp. NGMCC 1.201702]|uniref:hypothetical protein n=1 Tax=Pseudaminobacter sp. NGMCC 1.201702 TaxID=3391825 RepID=UPI0039EDF51F